MSIWLDPKNEMILRAQWAEGVNIQAIATLLSTTRNTIIGKAHRLNLPMHVNAAHHPDRPRKMREKRTSVRRPRTRTAPRPMVLIVSPAAPTSLDIAFLDLQPHHCRYATTADAPYLFCGEAKTEKSSYCAFHDSLCHETPKQRTRLNYVPMRRAA